MSAKCEAVNYRKLAAHAAVGAALGGIAGYLERPEGEGKKVRRGERLKSAFKGAALGGTEAGAGEYIDQRYKESRLSSFQQIVESRLIRESGGLEWHTHAGGTSAANGKYGYTSSPEVHGEYHISPISSESGLHRGYQLLHANSGKSSTDHLGLWSNIDARGHSSGDFRHLYRSPQAAKSAAKLHHQKMKGQ